MKAYNRTRHPAASKLICHAPTSAMNFEQGGAVTACCYNRAHVFGRYPQDKLEDIWFGAMAEELRDAISQNDLSKGCQLCERQILLGNFENTRARGFDVYARKKGLGYWLEKINQKRPAPRHYPQVLEFELDNICNLECKMCNGKFSSLIRKNREKLPPLENVYDDAFVTQLDAFIPQMKEAKFLGGEPFLIPVYWQIWDRIKTLNPKAKIHITTNGTLLSERVKRLLHDIRPNIIISIDSLNKSNYELIRQNANFEKVWDNVRYLKAYTQQYSKEFSFAVCPMTLNWHELPDILHYCNENNIWLYLNTVTDPKKYSLYALHPEKLKDVIAVLQSKELTGTTRLQKSNNRAYQSLIDSLDNTYEEEVIRYDQVLAQFRTLSQKTREELSRELIIYNTALYEDKSYQMGDEHPDDGPLRMAYQQLKDSPELITVSYGQLLVAYRDAFGTAMPDDRGFEQNLNTLQAFLLTDDHMEYFERLMVIHLNEVINLLSNTEPSAFRARLYEKSNVEQWLNSRS